jgi:hypothetical protein
MTATTRQNNLILNEDWKRIYQTFKNADFKSYDFENLRRVIIDYIRENYPEDFNDYIESSEYLALIDAIAFLGQSLSFRIDLASRENFLELAERKENILRLARMLGYNAKRNIPANGLLKFDTISTTEDIVDGNGKNLSQQVIIWNDPTNASWNEQFLLILNSAMADNTEFGRSQGSAFIQGVQTDQYRFRTASTDVPIYSFTKTVASRRMSFELVSTSFIGKEELYEEDPTPANQLGFIYKNDSKGPASANNGFFLLFKQGSLEVANFSISVPTTNEKVSVDAQGINNSDLWLYSLASTGAQTTKWTQVPALVGNNIAYNSLTNQIKNIYAVNTKENDKIDLLFSDGVYGNLPQGNFRVYYRVSNGLSYSIAPTDMRGITISIPYINSIGVSHTLTISMSLKYTVSSSTPAETTDSIRANAPAVYYTQNRMITGEDYNLAPLSSSQDILKVKAINRTSSGISRNFDLIDASGKYSSVDVFADDGYLYKNDIETALSFKYANKIDIYNFIRQYLETEIDKTDTYNFYLTKFTKIIFVDSTSLWANSTSLNGSSTGYFINSVDNSKLKTGVYTNNTLKYLTPDALIKFLPGEGKAFKKGKIVTADANDSTQAPYIWTKVISVVGDGTNAGRGELASGLGPITFSNVVPANAIASRIIPKFVSNIPTALETEIVNLVFSDINFGLRYDVATTSWKIITPSNLNLVDDFTLGKTGDTSNSNLDASWIVAFVKQPDRYIVKIRGMEYVFGSLQKNRFYYDPSQKIYNSLNGTVIKDQVKVLGINTNSNLIAPLVQDMPFEISDSIRFEDGYQSTQEIKLGFYDSNSDGVIDDPDEFERIVGTETTTPPPFIFFQQVIDSTGAKSLQFLDNSNDKIIPVLKESEININDPYVDGQLFYFYDSAENVIKRINRATNTLVIDNTYRGNLGRAGLKFQYIHNANVDRRIDPSASNIIDVYLLTRSYDITYRNYLMGVTPTMPIPPNSDSLRINFGSNLNSIKSISDEIIYHPVTYKVLFGPQADAKLQAQFKVVKNPSRTLNDNDLKVRIVTAINTFFDVANWDFGDKFYLSELITYIINSTAPDISNMTIVPKQANQAFGSLFEIQSKADEIFVSGAIVDNIEIVSAINAAEIGAISGTIVTTTSNI